MKARLSLLHKQEAEWNKLSDWKPEAGEVVVYDPDENYDYARLKIGDGTKTLQELNFFIDKAISTALQNCQYYEIIDAGRVTDYKK
jgi:hypothetical protein